MQTKTNKVQKKQIGYANEYTTIMCALNIIDTYASEAVRDNNNGEAQELAKAYTKVANFISKYAGR